MNTLYPIFLKLHELQVLIVGGGNVGLEKLSFMLKNSPDARINLVGITVKPEIWKLATLHENVKVEQRAFEQEDLIGIDLLLLATADLEMDAEIKAQAKSKGILVNVADQPSMCDFYLGSIVSKGDLKVAISTNGKSPTLAKRMREYLEATLPDNTQEIIDNLGEIRAALEGDFKAKLDALNEITAVLKSKQEA